LNDFDHGSDRHSRLIRARASQGKLWAALPAFLEAEGTQERLAGQAVIEGVMMRGRRAMAVAVRRPSGEIVVHAEPLPARLYTGPVRRLPFLRGAIILWDALVLGMRALMYSANVALAEREVEFETPVIWGTMILSLSMGVGLFFVLPLLLVNIADRYITSSLASNIVEGLIRLGLLIAYIALIGLLPDIRRVFAYHGAEHKAVNAYEDGVPLEPRAVRAYSTAHARCGTGFLLIVAVLAILIFAFLGRPPLVWRILSRLLLIPLIAGLAYELVRLSAAHRHNPLVRVVLAPSLALQGLTTREPDDSMLEVAIAALERVLEEDRGKGEEG